MKAKDLKPGDRVRDEHSKVHTVREVTGSWYRGHVHLHWGSGPDDFVQTKGSTPLHLVDNAWEEGVTNVIEGVV